MKAFQVSSLLVMISAICVNAAPLVLDSEPDSTAPTATSNGLASRAASSSQGAVSKSAGGGGGGQSTPTSSQTANAKPTPDKKATSKAKPVSTKTKSSSNSSSARPSASASACPYKGVPSDSPKAAKPMTLEEVKKNLRAIKKILGDDDDDDDDKDKKKKKKKSSKTRGYQVRGSKDHPSAKKSITLYHGTSESAAKAILEGGVDTIKTNDEAGEFTAAGYSGFYMTDDKIAAAQYIKALKPKTEPIAVLEFKWTPPDATKVKELDDDTDEDLELLTDFQTQNIIGDDMGIGFKAGDFDMISGPHVGRVRNKKIITQNMWQYAIPRKEGFSGLKVVDYQVYKKCNVPDGELPYLKDFQDV